MTAPSFLGKAWRAAFGAAVLATCAGTLLICGAAQAQSPGMFSTSIANDKWLRQVCSENDKSLCRVWIDAFLIGYRAGFLAYGMGQSTAKICLPAGGLPLDAIAAVYLESGPLPHVDGSKVDAGAVLTIALSQKFPCPAR